VDSLGILNYRGGMAIAFLIFFISCKHEIKPAHILTKEEMVKVLTDIYITEEKMNRLSLPRDSTEKIFEEMKRKIFEKQAVADTAFKSSFNYYMDRPKEMELIYTALVDSLQLMEQRVPIHLDKK
jgi:hypothetical protein